MKHQLVAASLWQEMLGRLFVENFDLRRKLRGSQGTFMGPGTGERTVWIWHNILSFMMMLVNICDTMFECHFDAVWFCHSCLHRFGFGFFRFTGEHDASQPWTKLGFGELMQLRDGNCNQSWASRSESSSQVRSRLVFDMIMISSDKVFIRSLF